MKTAVLLIVVLGGSLPCAQAPQGRPMDFGAIRSEVHQIQFSQSFGSGVQPGDGLDLESPYLPKPVPQHPFQSPARQQDTTFTISGSASDTERLGNQRLDIRSTFRENITVAEEAQLLSVNFRASFAFSSFEAAYEAARQSSQNGKAIYFLYSIEGYTAPVSPAAMQWPDNELADIEAIESNHLRIAKFVAKYGSHFTQSIRYGARIAIRAHIKTTDQSRQQAISGKIRLAIGLFQAGGSIDQESLNSLRESDLEIQAEVIAGGVHPTGAVVLTDLSQVAQFLNAFRNGTVKLQSGPVSCWARSYWPTIPKDRYPKLWNDLAPLVRDPAPSPYGVPRGTILAWYPRESDWVIEDFNGSRVERLVPPDGWRVCNGSNGTPDLTGKFVMGTVVHSEVQGEVGSPQQTPSGGVSFAGYAEGEINYDRGPGRRDQFQMQYAFKGNPISIIPPSVRLVYIMRE